MKKLYHQFVSIILAFFTLIGTVQASVVDYGAENSPDEKTYTQTFSDVPTDHWAFQYIEELVQRKAINGYPDGKFYPNKIVTREEFAKIMIVAAGRTTTPAQVSSYADVPLTYWASPFIETAKPYMTAYQSGGQTYFKPTEGALREDMAVAVVMLKGYDTRLADLSMIQTMFSDIDAISVGAQPYVALAVENGIISGYSDGTFRGQATITRCEAAAILWRAFQYGSDSKLMPGETAVPVPSATPEPSETPSESVPEPAEPEKPYVVDTLVNVEILDARRLMTVDGDNHVVYYDDCQNAIVALSIENGDSEVLLDVENATVTKDSTVYTDFEMRQIFWDGVSKQFLVYGTFNTIQGIADDGWTLPTTHKSSWTGVFTIKDGKVEAFAEEPKADGSGYYYPFNKIEHALSNGDFIVRYQNDKRYLYNFKTGRQSTYLTDFAISIAQSGHDIYRVCGDEFLYKYDYASGTWVEISEIPFIQKATFQNDVFYSWLTTSIYGSASSILSIRPSDGATQQKVDLENDIEVLDIRTLPSIPEAFFVTTNEEYVFYDSAATAIRIIKAVQTSQ